MFYGYDFKNQKTDETFGPIVRSRCKPVGCTISMVETSRNHTDQLRKQQVKRQQEKNDIQNMSKIKTSWHLPLISNHLVKANRMFNHDWMPWSVLLTDYIYIYIFALRQGQKKYLGKKASQRCVKSNDETSNGDRFRRLSHACLPKAMETVAKHKQFPSPDERIRKFCEWQLSSQRQQLKALVAMIFAEIGL